jgi:hypothetical protein
MPIKYNFRLNNLFKFKRKNIHINGVKIRCKKIIFHKRNNGNQDIFIKHIVKLQNGKKIKKEWLLNCDSANGVILGDPLLISETEEEYKDKNGNRIKVYIMSSKPGDPGYDSFDKWPCIPKITKGSLEEQLGIKLTASLVL